MRSRWRSWTAPVESAFALQVGLTLLGRSASLILSLATTAMTARWLGPGGKGELAILLLVPSTMQLILSAGISTANTYYAGATRLSVAQLSSNSGAFALLGTCAGGGLALLLLKMGALSSLLPGIPAPYLALALLALPLGIMSENIYGILAGLGRISVLNMLSVGQTALIVALTALCVVRLKLGVPGAVAAWVAAQSASLLAAAWCVKREGGGFRPRWDPRVVGPTLRFGLKGYIGNMLQFLSFRLDAYLLLYFLGPVSVGVYAASVSLAELLWQLPNAAGFVLFPKAVNSSPETMNQLTPRVFWIVLGVSAIGAAGLAAFGKLAIRLIFSGTYADAYLPLLALLPGVVLMGASRILFNDITGRGYPHYNSVIAGLTFAATALLDLFLIPRNGVLGAAAASTLSYAFNFVLSVGFYLAVSRGLAGRGIADRHAAQVEATAA